MRTYLCLDHPAAAAIEAAIPTGVVLDKAAQRGAGLGDPTRVRIACVLAAAGELCVGDTATLLDLPISLVSHHVRLLARCGLAGSRRDGKLVRYHLTATGRDLLAAVTGITPVLLAETAPTQR